MKDACEILQLDFSIKSVLNDKRLLLDVSLTNITRSQAVATIAASVRLTA